MPFVALHLSCLLVLWVGWSPVAVATAIVLYAVRAFGITAFYHRGFAHRAFAMPRAVQLGGAILGAAAAQRGPLWWVAHHRRHHRATDRPGDPHSPVRDGFTYSHLGWMFAPANQATDTTLVEDLAAFPELRLLDRFCHVVPVALLAALFAAGWALAAVDPGLGTSGPQLAVWGFAISTALLFEATFAINSVAHLWGTRRFDTSDRSRNVWWLALPTLGEAWHNNHHRFPSGARQGFAPGELDLTWIGLRAMARVGLVRSLRPVPGHVLAVARPTRV